MICRLQGKDIGSGDSEERDEFEGVSGSSSEIVVLQGSLGGVGEALCHPLLWLMEAVDGSDSTSKGWLLWL